MKRLIMLLAMSMVLFGVSASSEIVHADKLYVYIPSDFEQLNYRSPAPDGTIVLMFTTPDDTERISLLSAGTEGSLVAWSLVANLPEGTSLITHAAQTVNNVEYQLMETPIDGATMYMAFINYDSQQYMFSYVDELHEASESRWNEILETLTLIDD